MEQPTELRDYPITIEVPVLWGHQDAFGHVNNTLAFRWFESARMAYYESPSIASVLRQQGQAPILAAIHCNFRIQLNYPDTLLIGARITRLGRTSMTMHHTLFSTAQGQAACDGDSVVVVFNYAKNRSEPISQALREAVEALEKGSFS